MTTSNPFRDFLLRTVAEEREATLQGLAVLTVDACLATGPGGWVPDEASPADAIEVWLGRRGLDQVATAVGLTLAIRHTLRDGASTEPAPLHVPFSGLLTPPWWVTTAAWLVSSPDLDSLPRVRMAVKQIRHEARDGALDDLIAGLRWVSYAVVDPNLVDRLIDRLIETPPEQMLPVELRILEEGV